MIKYWLKALRYHFTAPSFISALLGSAIAVNLDLKFNILYFILLIVAIVCNHFALNMTDDYYDYLHGVDVLKTAEEQSQYSGGSGLLVAGNISPFAMKIAFFSFYAITSIIGLYFFIELGPIILLFGLIGFFSSYYYTAPPISFGYRGFGELAILLNFGPLIVISSYYLQAQNITGSIVAMSLPLGFLACSMVLFNEIPDFNTDLKANKKTLVVLFGKKVGFNLAVIAITATYVTIILSVILNYTTKIALISLITIPLAYKAIMLLKNSLNTPTSLGQLEMIKTHNGVGMLLIIAYLIQAFIDGKNILGASLIIIMSVLLYLPVILIVKKSS
jgi:1,4-dihydroxy-2-naphthoate octaprenyltransferase